MEQRVREGIGWYRSALFRAAGVWHGFGTKGVRIEGYLRALGHREFSVPETHQIHGAVVHCIPGAGPLRLEGDAFLTDRPGCVCHVRTADCVPILLSDPTRRVVGAVHSGWRGLAAGVIAAAIARLRAAYQVRPGDLRAAIGPAIGPCCYDIGEDVISALERAAFPIDRVACVSGGSKWRLDLVRCAVLEFERQGVPPTQIDMAGVCTHCVPEGFHSYRRDRSDPGRQVSFIVLR